MDSQPAVIGREKVQLSHNKRLRGRPYQLSLELLRRRDGDRNVCGHQDQTQTIDHIDATVNLCYCGSYHQDHCLENLRILCFNCNSAKGGPKKPSNVSAEREKIEPMLEQTPIARREDAYSNQIASQRKPKFLVYLFVRVKIGLQKKPRKEEYDANDVALDSVQSVKIGESTAYKWLSGFCTREGPFLNPGSEDGLLRLRKDEYQYLSEPEFLERFHPYKIITPERKEELEEIAVQKAMQALNIVDPDRQEGFRKLVK